MVGGDLSGRHPVWAELENVGFSCMELTIIIVIHWVWAQESYISGKGIDYILYSVQFRYKFRLHMIELVEWTDLNSNRWKIHVF